MTKYDQQYYITMPPAGEDYLGLSPDEKTFNRDYDITPSLVGSSPFFFINKRSDRDKRTGFSRALTDIVLDSVDLIISDKVKESLKEFDLSYIQFHPAVYIDDDDVWHENYWHLMFYNETRCLSRKGTKKHQVEDDIPDTKNNDYYLSVDKFSIDERVFDTIPEEQRLLFKFYGTSIGYVNIHEKIMNIFIKNKFTGLRYFKLADFTEGDQIDFG